MGNPGKILAVAETSTIIRKGLVHILTKLSFVTKVVELKELENINNQLNIIQPDGFLVNPMLLGHTGKNDIHQLLNLNKEVAVIALVYNLIDERLYKSYDAIIRINDSFNKIEELLSTALDRDTKKQSDQEDLSEREKDILRSVVKGMSNKEIADHHSISIHTVITHRRNIGRKLEIHSVSGLTIYAILNKLVDIKDIEI